MSLQSTAAPRRKMSRHRVGALALSAIVLGSSAVVGGVASAEAASNISTKPLDILLGVGATEAQRTLSWYYPATGVAQSVELEKTSDLAAGAFDGDKKVISATTSANTAVDVSAAPIQSGYSNSHATLLNLEENTTYSYHVGATDGTNWSPTYTFKTQSFTGDFDFVFFGDPQIGSSGNADKDGAGWAATLAYATQQTPNAEIFVSGGDQVEAANNEYQWSAFADSSDVLKQYPFAATIGNHDVGGKAYEQHTTLPNLSKDADYYPGAVTSTNSGGDYYYIYKGVLFIDINSNAYSGGSDAAHVSYVRSVIKEVGDKAKWTALVYHHSIYSPADHANDADNAQRRTDFTTAFSDLGVDIVLQGHDHSYSRSYSILNGKKANVDEQPGQDEVFAGPGGVIYVTANSASGSKYYDLTKPDATKAGYGADPLDPTGNRHFANSVENQEHVRTYIQVSVSDDELQVKDIRAGDCSAPNAAVELGKVTTCGVGLKATASAVAAPVGSLVDQFSLLSNVDTTTGLTASSTSTVSNSTTPVVLSAAVAGGLGTLSGKVEFYEGSTLLGSSPVSDGKASYTLNAPFPEGTHSYNAKFVSDSVYTGSASTSSAVSIAVTAPVVTPTPTPTGTSTPTPTPTATTPAPVVKAVSTTALKYSKGIATVTVTAPNVAVAGSATIYDGTKAVATAKIANGTGTAKVALKTSGTHKLHAVFAPTDTVEASISKTINVKIAKSTTTLKYSKKKVSVTVKSSGHTVSGSVKVYDGKKVLKTIKVVKGKAAVKVNLKKGTHKLHAVYTLNDTIASSTSKTISVKIAK